jgi:hypothetical protein
MSDERLLYYASRVLAYEEPTFRVAFEAAWSHAKSWAAMATGDLEATMVALNVLSNRLKTDAAGIIAVLIRPVINSVWTDAEHARPQERGQFLGDGTPLGAHLTARAAAIIAGSIANIIEPEDDLADLVFPVWDKMCRELRKTRLVELGPLDATMRKMLPGQTDPGPAALAQFLEEEVLWPAPPGPFRQKLDEICARYL